MSVRAVAIRQGTYDRFRAVPRARWPSETSAVASRRGARQARIVPLVVRRAVEHSTRSRSGFGQPLWGRFADDRQLIGLKIVLLAALLWATALEVPL